MKYNLKRLDSTEDIKQFSKDHGMRNDWHEPDEQGIEARVFGASFDNAGFWGVDSTFPDVGKEMYVVLYKDGEPIAEANLATLFALAGRTIE